jgi:Asp-tRNA(Asn)/Glu-tRNA(Gln) amidotransferase A subunit family amidase
VIEAIAAGVRAGTLDPVEVTEQALARAEAAAGLNAIVHLDYAGARHAAANVTYGALAGVPLLVKEIVEVAGLPQRCGSAVFADRVAARDAEVVRRARAAGAVIIGLAHTHEFAYGCTGTSNVAGPCRNPADPARMPGGSSSGSGAAVAAGVVPLAFGTDTAGSVRIPAALCGCVGVVPARGTLPLDGVFPLATTLDRVGLLTSSVADARYALAALAGIELPSGPHSPPRLGFMVARNSSPEVGEAYGNGLDLLRAAGADLVEVKPPGWAELAATSFDIQGPEAAAVHSLLSASGYQPDVVERLRVASEVPGWHYVNAHTQMVDLAAELDVFLSTMDALILPTVPVTAPPLDAVNIGRKTVRELLLQDSRQLNVTDFPGMSIPLPTPGLPVGLQLMSIDNETAFVVGEWIEETFRDAAR